MCVWGQSWGRQMPRRGRVRKDTLLRTEMQGTGGDKGNGTWTVRNLVGSMEQLDWG